MANAKRQVVGLTHMNSTATRLHGAWTATFPPTRRVEVTAGPRLGRGIGLYEQGGKESGLRNTFLGRIGGS